MLYFIWLLWYFNTCVWHEYMWETDRTWTLQIRVEISMKTYWNGNTSSSTKCSLANIRIRLKLRFTVQAGTQEQPSIKWNNCKNDQYRKPKPSTYFGSIRCRKDSNTTKNIYAYKIQNMNKGTASPAIQIVLNQYHQQKALSHYVMSVTWITQCHSVRLKIKFSEILFTIRCLLIISSIILCLPLSFFRGLKIMQSTLFFNAEPMTFFSTHVKISLTNFFLFYNSGK